MSGKIDEFLAIQNKKNRVALSVFSRLSALGYGDDFLDIYQDSAVIEQIILELHPTSIRSITTICSLVSAYAKFIENNNAYQTIQNIDRNLLWEKAKPNAAQKYLSHELYLNVIHDIGMFEETNALYYQTLFRVIYEGVYCEDMSVIANLRASDIDGNIVELHTDDGYSYKIALPEDLIEDLKELAASNEWERKNRYGIFKMKVSGRYPDSCFKIENRKDDSDTTYRFGYYNKLRKIAKEYLEYNISPLQLFISGIMYHIRLELDKKNISIEDAFAEENRNKTVMNIITKELSRCEYDIPVKALREQVVGYLEVFTL